MHYQKIIHRDIKPSNLLRADSGEVRMGWGDTIIVTVGSSGISGGIVGGSRLQLSISVHHP